MSDIEFRTPLNSEEFKEYDLFRWRILRKPIGKDINSLKDDYEKIAFHLIGIKDGIIIGCGRLHFNNQDEAQIRYMAVEESLQKKGIGRKILELLEENAIKNNAKKIILNARDHVLKFYESSNYICVDKYHGSDTGIPHTTMIKKI
tara:strand:- start:747 stop:1184 length:438 start_codon:yes stop_codon:yes gene_type:complete